MNHVDYSYDTCDDTDDLEHEMLLPGFRFQPTEEELLEFYLRRKVEGKGFNVELITFLDLYRHDPWELPALAAIGEKQWFFYVPRDRKYRNGDRPNRVTVSGYWKATGADRMIKGEGSRSIGMKKTLVFYYGKAPKGIRTTWIMNECRLPQHETERYQKVEISICRVFKRPGVEEHRSLPRCITSRASSSRAATQLNRNNLQNADSMEKLQPSNVASDLTKIPEMSKDIAYQRMAPIGLPSTVAMNEHGILLEEAKNVNSLAAAGTNLFAGSPFSSIGVEDLEILLSYQEQQVSASINQREQYPDPQNQQSLQYFTLPQYPEELSRMPNSTSFPALFQERFVEWNHIAEGRTD